MRPAGSWLLDRAGGLLLVTVVGPDEQVASRVSYGWSARTVAHMGGYMPIGPKMTHDDGPGPLKGDCQCQWPAEAVHTAAQTALGAG